MTPDERARPARVRLGSILTQRHRTRRSAWSRSSRRPRAVLGGVEEQLDGQPSRRRRGRTASAGCPAPGSRSRRLHGLLEQARLFGLYCTVIWSNEPSCLNTLTFALLSSATSPPVLVRCCCTTDRDRSTSVLRAWDSGPGSSWAQHGVDDLRASLARSRLAVDLAHVVDDSSIDLHRLDRTSPQAPAAPTRPSPPSLRMATAQALRGRARAPRWPPRRRAAASCGPESSPETAAEIRTCCADRCAAVRHDHQAIAPAPHAADETVEPQPQIGLGGQASLEHERGRLCESGISGRCRCLRLP